MSLSREGGFVYSGVSVSRVWVDSIVYSFDAEFKNKAISYS